MRKGLSQILYLIIAASVLMMIAMVITFTATDTLPEDNSTEIPESEAIHVAEAYTWKQCSVDRVSDYDEDVHLDCCEQYVTGGVEYRACEDVRVFRNDPTGGIEVRN